jgi:tRNA nucleotidyltransferase (CCA-adding enzyme)
MRRLTLSNAERMRVVKLCEHGLLPVDVSDTELRRALGRAGRDAVAPDLVRLFAADEKPELAQRAEAILQTDDALTVAELKISGEDLLKIGVPKGPEVGGILKSLLEEVLESPRKNQREGLLERAQALRAR